MRDNAKRLRLDESPLPVWRMRAGSGLLYVSRSWAVHDVTPEGQPWLTACLMIHCFSHNRRTGFCRIEAGRSHIEAKGPFVKYICRVSSEGVKPFLAIVRDAGLAANHMLKQ